MESKRSFCCPKSCHWALILLLLPLLAGCKERKATYEELLTTLYTPEYAPGFILYGLEGMESTIVRVTNPWQGAEGVEMDAFVQRAGEVPPEGFEGEVIPVDPERIVALSSSYIGMLEALGEVERIVGVSGLPYISNEYITDSINGVVDLGQMTEYERLVALEPSLLLFYGVDDAQSAMTARLEELGVPYLYMGEYLEEHPLGRAEWLVVLAELLDKREEGVALFKDIVARYEATRALAEGISDADRPLVMLNLPWNDAWFLPSSQSYIARLIRDAGASPITGGEERGVSNTIGIEQALLHLSEAEYWLHPSMVTRYSDFPPLIQEQAVRIRPIQLNQIYNNNAQSTPAGGSDFWERGVVEPDVILADLLEIFHPERIEHELHYYQKITTP